MTLALTAAAPTVIDADRAFAQLAKDRGQWTAFRTTAAPDALFFTPQPVNALADLKDVKDPPKSVDWWPTAAWQSCDGTLGVTTGDAIWPDGHASRYTTIWKRQPDGVWKWVYDNGQNVPQAKPDPHLTTVIVAKCPASLPAPPSSIEPAHPPMKGGDHISDDWSLTALWAVAPNGKHWLTVQAAGFGEVHATGEPIPTPKQ